MADNESKEINTEEKPKFRSHLNEGYWFDVGKRLVDGAETNLKVLAASLYLPVRVFRLEP